MNPLVSIIIPTYNRSSLLLLAIKSVLNQTILSIEVLVCDDGSTDDTKNLVQSLTDTRVVYIDCGHTGLASVPRNIGIKKAKGNWIAFLDDDDEWFPSKLEEQLEFMKKYRLHACCSNAYKVNTEHKNLGLYFINRKNKILKFKDFQNENPVICASMIIHKSIINSGIQFPEKKCFKAIEDYAMWYKISIYNNIGYLERPLLSYLTNNTTSIRDSVVIFTDQKKLILEDFNNWKKELSFIENLKVICINYFNIIYTYIKNKFYRILKKILKIIRKNK